MDEQWGSEMAEMTLEAGRCGAALNHRRARGLSLDPGAQAFVVRASHRNDLTMRWHNSLHRSRSPHFFR